MDQGRFRHFLTEHDCLYRLLEVLWSNQASQTLPYDFYRAGIKWWNVMVDRGYFKDKITTRGDDPITLKLLHLEFMTENACSDKQWQKQLKRDIDGLWNMSGSEPWAAYLQSDERSARGKHEV